MRKDDAELIRRTLAGDDTAFTMLVNKYHKHVHTLAWRKIGDFHIAEDITQDTFLQVYRDLAMLKEPDRFLGWLYVVTTRRCIAWSRKNQLHIRLAESINMTMKGKATYSRHVADEQAKTTVEAQREVVKQLLDKLKESERTVMTLYYFGEMTCEEIGKFLGVSANTIKSRLSRARQRLKKEEPMIRETLNSFQLSANLTENIVREMAHIKPVTPSGSKPLLPWGIAVSTLTVILLMIGVGNQYLLHFQRPYSFEAESEHTIEIIDAPIVLGIDSKPDVRNQVGRDGPSSKNSGAGSQDSETLLASTAGEAFVQHEKNTELCTQNMVAIGKALQTYRSEHGKLPLWLSALHRKYLTDKKILLCPADGNRGKPSYYRRTDPVLPVSYDYAQYDSGYQELTTEQLYIYGDVIPIVRCGHHANEDFACLNLGFSGGIYQSNATWAIYEPEVMYGSIGKAVAAFEVKLQDAPDDERIFELYPALIRLYVKDEQEEKANDLINRFKLVMGSEDIKDTFVLGDMFEAMDRHQDALQVYEEAEMQHPKNRDVFQRLAQLHEKLGNKEIAKVYQLKFDPALALIGKTVPNFSVTDLDGKPISLQDYRGKVVLLDFWAVWCPPCTDEIPNIRKVYNTYKDAGFDVIGVSLDREESKLRNYITANAIPWRQIFSGKGWDSPVSRQYNIKRIPAPWLIDQEGKLISHNGEVQIWRDLCRKRCGLNPWTKPERHCLISVKWFYSILR